MENKKKILITTGIYPPKIGGPAQYAKNVRNAFEKDGCDVYVQTYNLEDRLPIGIRHIFFFLKILPFVSRSDCVLALDTFSVGFPSVAAARIFGKDCIIRTGGDFLWEQYVERTGTRVFLRDFYQSEINNFSRKEKMIYRLTKRTLRRASHVVFSTQWQRNIFIKAYGLAEDKTSVIENYYGPKESDMGYESKMFVGSSRNLVLKNSTILTSVFNSVRNDFPDSTLFLSAMPFDNFMEKIRSCYAVINVSLSEISPNIILDAIRCNKPFISTREVGIYERIKDIGIYVNPLDEAEIKKAVLYLLDEANYENEKEKIRRFNFIHTWEDIAGEFIEAFNSLKK